MSVDASTITVTGVLQHQAWRDRLVPPVEEVRPGLWSIPTPFTMSPLRYVLAYLVETRGGLALIDTGWPDDTSWSGLVDGIRQAGHEVADVSAVLVTHSHADHFGLAHRVREASGARVAMHTLDIEAMKRWTSLSDFAASDTDWLTWRGADPVEIAAMVPEDRADGGMLAKLGRADVGLEDGDRPMGAGTPLRAIWTPGHTPGHLCFLHEEHGVLLTGDHILPRISPNISPAPNNDTDALGDYLGSLAAVADLEVDEVLPAHEYRFSGLAIRVGQLQAHHAQRLAEIIAVVADHSAATTFQIAERLTWSRPWAQTQGMIRRAAIGETYAHLLHLTRKGLLINGPGEVDDWQLSAAGAETIVG